MRNRVVLLVLELIDTCFQEVYEKEKTLNKYYSFVALFP